MPAEVGQPAPDFTLKDQDNNEVSLADFKGEKTVIVFIPFPFSGICTTELCAIRDDYSQLSGLGAKIVVITCDTRFSNKRFQEDNNLPFPILSDYWPHGAIAQAYGCFNEVSGGSLRWSYVLDEKGIVREIINSEGAGVAREHERYAKALAAV